MAHHVQVNTDNVVIDNIPYNMGAVALVEDDAFAEIPSAMFTSGRLTDLGEVSGGGGFDLSASKLTVNWFSGQIGPLTNLFGIGAINIENAELNAPDQTTLASGDPGVAAVELGDHYELPAGVANIVAIKSAGWYYVQLLFQPNMADGAQAVQVEFGSPVAANIVASMVVPAVTTTENGGVWTDSGLFLVTAADLVDAGAYIIVTAGHVASTTVDITPTMTVYKLV